MPARRLRLLTQKSNLHPVAAVILIIMCYFSGRETLLSVVRFVMKLMAVIVRRSRKPER